MSLYKSCLREYVAISCHGRMQVIFRPESIRPPSHSPCLDDRHHLLLVELRHGEVVSGGEADDEALSSRRLCSVQVCDGGILLGSLGRQALWDVDFLVSDCSEIVLARMYG